MITFKDFLIESQNYPLYHGTSVDRIIDIISSNKLKNIWGYADASSNHKTLHGKRTVSLTRSKSFASFWGKRVDWANKTYNDKTPPSLYGAIELNRGKLRTRHKIVPYNHFAYEGAARKSHNDRFGNTNTKDYRSIDMNQYEERVVGDINHIDRYITTIYLTKNGVDMIKNEHPEIYNKIIKLGWLKII